MHNIATGHYTTPEGRGDFFSQMFSPFFGGRKVLGGNSDPVGSKIEKFKIRPSKVA